MKEINIARAIVNKRKEKGITQDDLANYIGVSKASVSKWETGQSYPDITFLPQIAAYFNISIDELMGYEPQMTKEDISKLYHEFSIDFTSKPFDEVISQCREIIKKYFSCFPLLLQMGRLLFNHSALSDDTDKTVAVIGEAKELFIRIRQESNDAELMKQALYLEANCEIALGNPNEAVELLEGTVAPISPNDVLLASAYQLTGKMQEAKTVLQAGMYQHIIALFGLAPSYIALCADDMERLEETYGRILVIAETFNMKTLHPAILINLYLSAAQGYMTNGNMDKSLDMLEKYAELVTGDIYPLQLKGDNFFNLLDDWLAELDLGAAPPRGEETIRQSMADMVIENPAFSPLANERRFRRIVEKLKNND